MGDAAMAPPEEERAVAKHPLGRSHRTPASSGERRSFLYRKSGIWTVRIATAAALLTGWQLYARTLPKALMPTPSSVAIEIYHLVAVTGDIRTALASSLTALGLGYSIALAVGLPIGIAMGRSRTVEHVLDPYVSFLYALPHVSFVPLMVIWLGFDLKFRLAYVVFSAVFPVIINTMTGVKNVDPELIDVGKSFCGTERQTLRTIILPAASPYMLAGARQAFSSAWVGVVVAEVLSTQTGLGGLITHFSNYFLTADMFVPILFIMLIAILIQVLTDVIQRRITPWVA